MRILITGATGFLGAAVCERLVAAGHDVHAIVRPETELPYALYGVSPVRQDLMALDMMQLPSDVDALITLAQFREFRNFPAGAPDLLQVNVQAHNRLFVWAATTGVSRIVHASSGGVYGGRRRHHFVETEPVRLDASLGLYLASKACSELVLTSYRPLVPSITTLRPFFIYGAGMPADRLIARLAYRIVRGEPITLDGPRGLSMNPVHVDDAAHAVIASLDLDGHRTVNVAGAEVTDLRSLCETMGGYLDRAPVFETRAAEPLDYLADISTATSLWGAPTVSLRDGLQRMLAVMRDGETVSIA